MTYMFKLQRADGTAAEPPSVRLAVPNMRPGDTIPLSRDRTLRVIGTVAALEGEDPVLLVEDVAASATSAGS
jgi:hypothetical protein